MEMRLCVRFVAGCTSGVVLQSSVYPLSILGRQFWASAALLSRSPFSPSLSPSATVFWISVVCWGLCGASEIGPSAASAVLWPAVAKKKRKKWGSDREWVWSRDCRTRELTWLVICYAVCVNFYLSGAFCGHYVRGLPEANAMSVFLLTMIAMFLWS